MVRIAALVGRTKNRSRLPLEGCPKTFAFTQSGEVQASWCAVREARIGNVAGVLGGEAGKREDQGGRGACKTHVNWWYLKSLPSGEEGSVKRKGRIKAPGASSQGGVRKEGPGGTDH